MKRPSGPQDKLSALTTIQVLRDKFNITLQDIVDMQNLTDRIRKDLREAGH